MPWVVPKMALRGRFLGQNSVFCQNSKEFLENLNYFISSEALFEKKVSKKQVKSAYFREITVFYPISPYFTLFCPFYLIRATSWGTATNLGIKG